LFVHNAHSPAAMHFMCPGSLHEYKGVPLHRDNGITCQD
jgi:hypothetical protein